jgi:subtilisin family serine protease
MKFGMITVPEWFANPSYSGYGVDYNHPDLTDNIWVTPKRLNGIAGFDDDGNGFIDDIRGGILSIMTMHLLTIMHGTHVGELQAGGNNLGIAGAAWNVKLMPLKFFKAMDKEMQVLLP